MLRHRILLEINSVVKSYLCFTALEINSTLKLNTNTYNIDKDGIFEYSEDKIIWIPFKLNDTKLMFTNTKDKLYIRNTLNKVELDKFITTGKFNVSHETI